MEPGSLVIGSVLSYHSAIDCPMAVDELEDVVGCRDALD